MPLLQASASIENNPYLIHQATIVGKVQESDTIHTYRLRIDSEDVRRHYRFLAGQFNMIYLFGVGEVAIFIASASASAKMKSCWLNVASGGPMKRFVSGVRSLGQTMRTSSKNAKGGYGSAEPV